MIDREEILTGAPVTAAAGPSARRRTRWHGAAAAVMVCVAVARIASTYPEFTQTFDEPFHIACGMQLLRQHIYTIELQHPPLARLADALLPYLAGLRPPATGDAVELGNGILHDGGSYWRNLTLARLGTLPFFLLACGVVWLWGNRAAGRWGALTALFLFTQLPPVLAHGALATTDMACAATVSLALFCLVLWMENPDRRRSLALGAATGLAAVSKFSSLLFLPACAAVLIVLRIALGPAGAQRPWREIARNLAMACLAGYFVIWAGYLFPMEPVLGPPPHPVVDRLFHRIPALENAVNGLLQVPIPAGQLPNSLKALSEHARGGHTAFFLGEWRKRGWWYYFPVVVALKTPPALLLLALAGAFFLALRFRERREWLAMAPFLFVLAILLSTLFSRINIGSRHVLAIYTLLAVLSGYGVCELWRSATRVRICRAAALAGVLGVTASSVLAHPNYLAYFNFMARQPERVEVDSDLDWGQDLDRLARWLRAHDVREVYLSYFGTADLEKSGLPEFHELEPYLPVNGWVAISAYNRALQAPFTVTRVAGRAPYYAIPGNFESLPHTGGPFAWLLGYTPVAKVGSSIFVYHVAAK